MTDPIEFTIPDQKRMKKLDGRQIAIMLENTLNLLRNEMSKRQRKDFTDYFGDMTIVNALGDV